MSEFFFHTELLAIRHLQLRCSYPGTGFLDVSALINFYSLYPSVSLANFKGTGLSHDLTSLTNLKRLVDFSVCLDIYLLMGWSCEF